MPGPASIIKALHHLRRHIDDLVDKVATAPKQKISQEKKLAVHEDALVAAKELIKRLTLDTREKENSVRATQQQLQKYEKQLEAAANKKEFDALKSEIASSKNLVSKLEDEILATIGEIEAKTAQLPTVEQAVQKARDEFTQWLKDFEERVGRFDAEKARAHEELKSTEDTLPADVRTQYDRLIIAKGTECMAGLNGKSCVECYTEITSQMLSELKRDVFVICKNCGRMLYIAT